MRGDILKMHKVETGERYGDDSGWERRVMMDVKQGVLEIEIQGALLTTHSNEIVWLIQALHAVDKATGDDA